MKKGLLCCITGLTGFGAGIFVSKMVVKLACEQIANERRRGSVKCKNYFSDYLNKTRFSKEEA